MYLTGMTVVLLVHGLVAWAILHATNVESAVMTPDKGLALVALISAGGPDPQQAPAPETVLPHTPATHVAIEAVQDTTPAKKPAVHPATTTAPHTGNKTSHVRAKTVPTTRPPDPDNPANRDVSQFTDKLAMTTDRSAPDTGALILQAGQHCPKPEYPKISRRLLEQGIVTIRFLLGTDGRVLRTEIARTSGFSRLDIAARHALERCQFRNVAIRNRSGSAWALIHYSWQLN
jgi:protein TonB